LKAKGLVILFSALCFFLAAQLVDNFFGTESSNESVASLISTRLETELKKIDDDFARIGENPDGVTVTQLSNPVFIYQRERLIFWSDNDFIPQLHVASDTFDVRLLATGNDAYLLKKRKLDNNRYIISLITLIRRYPITNDFFKTEYNKQILPNDRIHFMEPSAQEGAPVCIGARCFFRIEVMPDETADRGTGGWISFILIGLSVILFIAAVFEFLPAVTARFPELGFFYLTAAFFILRFGMVSSGFPGDYVSAPLFDPQVFASSTLNASLGDLLFNLLLVLVISYFVFRNYFRFSLQHFKHSPAGSWSIGVFSALVILFSALFPVVVIQTLYNNSSIAIDIARSLDFDFPRVIALAAILTSGICAFLFLHAFTRTLLSLDSVWKILGCLLFGSLIFAAVNFQTGQLFIPTLIITVAYVLAVYVLNLHDRLKTLNFSTFAYLFVAILFLAVNGAFTVGHFTAKEKAENQFRFASNFLIDRDIFAEYLLNESSRKIASDVFIQSRITSPFLGKDAIRQKIRQVYLPTYFNKYDVAIRMFNSIGEPVDLETIPLSDFLSRFDQDAYRTQYDGIRFINNPESDVAQRYLVIIPINRAGITGSHIIIELSLKKVIPENVYPELLVDYSYQQFYRTQDLSYAVYANKKPVFTSGEFNYDRFFDSRLFGEPELYNRGLLFSDYFHIGVEDQEGRIAIVSSRRTPFTHQLANFSFFLTLGLLILLILIFFQGVFQYFKGSRLFFSARIQLYLNLAFFIPLLIVSVSTLSLTSRSSQQQLNDEYLNKSRAFGQQMTNALNEDLSSGIGDNTTVESRLTMLAKLSNLDANIFDPSGILMATSQPLIYERNLLSVYINPMAYGRIKAGETLFVESEKVGRLEYFVSYAVLKSAKNGRLMGILGIPFFQSAYALEKVQSVILINILNIFALIFILLLLLSYIVAERLTYPLRFITQSLRRTSLTKMNTPLTWPAHDEIGFMVKEYNAMLYKLSESKSELEQTQREKAWREIAQQVAHEIKNPLTPMKLTLQQLERALHSGVNSNEKTQKAIAALLGQVDTLDQIASSFSGFVKMPEPVIQQVELVSIVKRVVDLHSPTGEIIFKTAVREAWIAGDAQLLSRTFSNIILNGIQAAVPGHPINIEVVIEVVNSICTIAFRDNGKGIDPAIADRVFVPHFSTKKSGSGLGLAIAKQGIEQMNGKIWFETKPGQGTTFFISLPLSTSLPEL
jgi:two-component system, NtrC family, nitrogen regulation sensor histidine kinase NtrY